MMRIKGTLQTGIIHEKAEIVISWAKELREIMCLPVVHTHDEDYYGAIDKALYKFKFNGMGKYCIHAPFDLSLDFFNRIIEEHDFIHLMSHCNWYSILNKEIYDDNYKEIKMGKLNSEELVKAQSEDRLLVLPVPLNTPVIRLCYNQHDGYSISTCLFTASMVNEWGETYFAVYKEAQKKIEEFEKRVNDNARSRD